MLSWLFDNLDIQMFKIIATTLANRNSNSGRWAIKIYYSLSYLFLADANRTNQQNRMQNASMIMIANAKTIKAQSSSMFSKKIPLDSPW